MSERLRRARLRRDTLARLHRERLDDELHEIVEAEKPEVSERNVLTDFVEEQRASREAFEAEMRRKIQALNRFNRTAWFYGAVGWIAAAILAVVLAEVTR